MDSARSGGRTQIPLYDPRAALVKGQSGPDAVPVRLDRPAQPGFRTQSNSQTEVVQLVQNYLKQIWRRYRYTPLLPEHIRLVVIRPGVLESPIEVDLISASFKDAEKRYKALSYEWGEGLALQSVILRDYTHPLSDIQDVKEKFRRLAFRAYGTRFFVRQNLYEALRHLRQPHEAVVIWVDAICINQLNDEEKANQVRRMAEIYNKASFVNVWLGTASDKSDDAMDFIKDLVRSPMIQNMRVQGDSGSRFLGLIELMTSRWFSRRWIIQELSLTASAAVHCGAKIVHWDDFADAISILDKLAPDVRSHLRSLHFPAEGLNLIKFLGAKTLSETKSIVFEWDGGKIVRRNLSLEHLVSRLTSFESGDPRDIIYSLLSIANDGTSELQPNYRQSLMQIFVTFVKHCVESSKSLDIICRHWAPVNTDVWLKHLVSEQISSRRDGPQSKIFKTRTRLVTARIGTHLPSWISQLDKSEFGTPSQIFRGRKHGESFIGMEPNQQRYAASGNRRMEKAFFGTKNPPHGFAANPDRFPTGDVSSLSENDRVKLSSIETWWSEYPKGHDLGVTADDLLCEIYDGTLTVRGIVLGGITEASGRMLPGTIPREALRMGGWKHSLKEQPLKPEEVPDRLWRTLVANKNDFGRPPEAVYRRKCLWAFACETASGDINISELLNRAEENKNQDVDVLKRIQETTWNRQIFKGGEDGESLFGLCSENAQIGDLVCILYGCSVPVVLRKSATKPQLGQRIVNVPAKVSPPATRKNTAVPSVETENHRSAYDQPPSAKRRKLDVQNPSSSSCYRLIGECYVHGHMEGTGINTGTPGQKEQDFVLV